MSTQIRPSLWRVLSDTSRIISSNSLHFAALSLLLILPLSLFNIIHALIQPPSTFPFNSHQILPKLLYALALLLFNILSASSFTHSTFHAFHRNPIKISSSLKSILFSFFPLLATKLAYFIIFLDISVCLGMCVGVVLYGMLVTIGLEIDPTAKSFMAVVFLMMIPFVYLMVECCLMDAVVVVESKYGFAPLKRSSTLVKGMRRVAFLMIAVPAILQGIIYWRFSVLGSGARTSDGGGVALRMVVCAALSTVLALFGVAATTVLFIHCKALNLEFQDKLGEVYVQLTHDVADEV